MRKQYPTIGLLLKKLVSDEAAREVLLRWYDKDSDSGVAERWTGSENGFLRDIVDMYDAASDEDDRAVVAKAMGYDTGFDDEEEGPTGHLNIVTTPEGKFDTEWVKGPRPEDVSSINETLKERGRF